MKQIWMRYMALMLAVLMVLSVVPQKAVFATEAEPETVVTDEEESAVEEESAEPEEAPEELIPAEEDPEEAIEEEPEEEPEEAPPEEELPEEELPEEELPEEELPEEELPEEEIPEEEPEEIVPEEEPEQIEPETVPDAPEAVEPEEVVDEPEETVDEPVQLKASTVKVGTNTISITGKRDDNNYPSGRWAFTPTATTMYTIHSESNGTYVDTICYLLDSSGNSLTYNDDGYGSGQFMITYKLTKGKKYYLAVGAYSTSVTDPVSIKLIIEKPTVYQRENSVQFDSKITKYKFVPKATGNYMFTSTDAYYDVEGFLYDADGEKLKSNNNGGYGNNFRLNYSLEKGETYYLGIRANDISSDYTSSCKVVVARKLTTGAKDVTLTDKNTLYWIKQSDSYALDFYSMGSTNTYGYLYDADYSLITSDGYSGGDNNFKFSAPITKNKVYFLKVQLNDSSITSGKTTIVVDEAQVKHGSQNINVSSEYTRYKFVPTATATYLFTTNTSYDTVGTIYNASGKKLKSNDNGGAGNNFRVAYKLSKGKTYYIAVKAKDASGTASVELRVYKKIVVGSKTLTLTGSDSYYFFQPNKNRDYTFYSEGDLDTVAYLYNNEFEQVDYNDDNDGNRNFNFTDTLTKGQVYYFHPRVYGAGTTEYQVTVVIQQEPAPISQATIKLSPSAFEYDGTEKRPSITVTESGYTLTAGVDYTYSYSNNIEVGTATVTIYGIGEFTGSKSKDFRIVEPDHTITASCVTLSKTSVTYNGKARKISPTVKLGGVTLVKDTDYKVSYKNNKNAGTATVTVTGIGEYIGTAKKTFTIKRKSIKSLTIALKSPSITYNAKARKPALKAIKMGTMTLKKNTDYTVSYKNNKKAGKGSAIVKGKGNFSGTVTKTFTIKKKALADTKISLSKTSYVYNGKAKKPTVTVKIGSVKLVKGTDFTVTYENNVKPGTAKAIIKGKGSCKGTVTKKFSITKDEPFKWGTSNWNFTNSQTYFVYASDGTRYTYRDQINSTYLSKLQSKLTSTEWQYINGSGGWLDDSWGGSCYGMSATTLLANLGKLPYTKYKSGATKLNQLPSPVNKFTVSSLITYYQMLQIRDVIQQQYRTVPYQSHETNIKKIVSELKKHPTVLIGFQGSFGGHAILAYGHKSGSWTWNGKTYDRAIQINDPNFSMSHDTEAYIFYRTSDYSWIIPAYMYSWYASSDDGCVFNCVDGDIKDINDGGYLNSSVLATAENEYVARLDAFEYNEGFGIAKASLDKGASTVNAADKSDDIKEGMTYQLGAGMDGTFGYNLFDSNSAYQIHQNAGKMRSVLLFKDTMALASGDQAEEAYFDQDFVSVSGQKGTYRVGLTLNKDYPTTWFNVEAEVNASGASLRKTAEGYILKASSLKNFTVYANNKEVEVSQNFSAKSGCVLIYQIDENTIGVRDVLDDEAAFEPNMR